MLYLFSFYRRSTSTVQLVNELVDIKDIIIQVIVIYCPFQMSMVIIQVKSVDIIFFSGQYSVNYYHEVTRGSPF